MCVLPNLFREKEEEEEEKEEAVPRGEVSFFSFCSLAVMLFVWQTNVMIQQ